jgi:hypothetical protein
LTAQWYEAFGHLVMENLERMCQVQDVDARN